MHKAGCPLASGSMENYDESLTVRVTLLTASPNVIQCSILAAVSMMLPWLGNFVNSYLKRRDLHAGEDRELGRCIRQRYPHHSMGNNMPAGESSRRL